MFLVDSSSSQAIVTPEAFLKLPMKGKIILNILLPPLGQDYKFVSFKVTLITLFFGRVLTNYIVKRDV